MSVFKFRSYPFKMYSKERTTMNLIMRSIFSCIIIIFGTLGFLAFFHDCFMRKETEVGYYNKITKLVYSDYDKTICHFRENKYKMVIAVISPRYNFERREGIRDTWANIRFHGAAEIRTVFIIGLHDPKSPYSYLNESKVNSEIEYYGDLIVGNFPDTNQNIVYKVLTGLKWFLEICPTADWFIKAQDDNFVDTLTLMWFLAPILPRFDDYLFCYQMENVTVDRDLSVDYHLSYEDYGGIVYPPYCYGNRGYILSAPAVYSLFSVAHKVKIIPMEDVYLTGLLREYYNYVENHPYSSKMLTIDDAWKFDRKGNKSISIVKHIKPFDQKKIYRMWNETVKFTMKFLNITDI